MIVQGNTTLGTNSSNTLTVNSSATFNQPPSMSGANITSNTIPPTCIVGGVGSSYANISKTNKTYTFAATNSNVLTGNGIDSITLTGPVGSVFLLTCNYAWKPYSDAPACFALQIGLSQTSTGSNGGTNVSLGTNNTDYLTVNSFTINSVGFNFGSYNFGFPLTSLFVTTAVNQVIYLNTYSVYLSGLDNTKQMAINYNIYAQRLA